MTELSDAGSLSALARVILPVLLDVTLKGALILAFAGVLTVLLRQTSAATRHLIWSLAICSVLALPVLTVMLPALQVSVLSEVPYLTEALAPADAALQALAAEPETMVVSSGNAEHQDVTTAGSEAQTVTVATEPAPFPLDEADPAQVGVPSAILNAFVQVYAMARVTPWTVWLLIIWLAGVLFVMLRLLVGVAGVGWLAFRARPMQDRTWNELSQSIRKELDLQRPIVLLRSTRTAMPMTWGLFRSVVLLPVSAQDWSEARRRCVLMHEMAHIKRWDCLTQTLAQVASALNWFNPLVWIAAREMREEREKACDDHVLSCGTRPSEYARHLLDIARTTRSTLVAPLGAVAMARPSQLEGRVVSILDTKRRRQATSRMVAVAGGVLTMLVVLPLAALHPAEAETREDADVEEARYTFQPVMTNRGEALRWTGRVAEGKTVTILGTQGLIRATTASGPDVEILAFLAEEPGHTLQIVDKAGSLVVCMPSLQRPGSCVAEEWAHQTQAPSVEYMVRLPAGVHFNGTTLEGDIKVVGLRGDVRATSHQGDILIETTGVVHAASIDGDIELSTSRHGQASTVNGDIRARLGKTTWEGTLPFNTVHGDITVELPAVAHTEIDLHVEADGHLSSALHLQQQSQQGSEHFQTTLGRGGRLLSLHSVDGDITITYAGQEELRTDEHIDVQVREPKRATYFADARARQGEPSWSANRSEPVRLRAIRAMLQDDSQNAVSTLSQVLLHDESPAVREKAAWGLGQIGCDQAVQALMMALHDESETVRAQVVQTLSEIQAVQAVPALAEALASDTSSKVRRLAAEALEQFDTGSHALATHSNTSSGTAAHQPLHLKIGDLNLGLSTEVVNVVSNVLADLDFEIQIDEQQIIALAETLQDQPSYASQMRKLGFKEAEDAEFFVAQLLGVDPAYTRAVRNAGYCPTLKELVHLKVAGVDAGFLRELKEEGYDELPVEELIALRVSGVDRQVIREMEEQGGHTPTVEEMVYYRTSRGPSAYDEPQQR